jgi:signal transduction histidine kinase
MRRRLFWSIVGVAAFTGLIVLAGATIASQRAAVDATFREMKKSTDEATAIVQEALDRAEQRPGAVLEILRLIEGDQLGPILGRILRSAGASEIAFALITDESELRSNAVLFDRVELDEDSLRQGTSQFSRTDTGELVVITPSRLEVRGVDATLLAGLAREAPVVRLADQFRGLILIVVGIGVLSALLARVLSIQLTKRLEPLAETSLALAGGDLSVRVPDLGAPELDDVARAFNEMAEDLEATATREREFILGVGHDLRTPLTTIGGYAEALEAGDVEEEEMRRIGAVLTRQSRQLSRLIEDLSTLARLEQPEFSLRMERVDVGAHITEIVEGFRRRADDVGVGLEVSAEEGLTIDTDPDRLGQITQNLVENGLRYTPETGTVSVSVSGTDAGVELKVADSGVGIAPEDLPKVFDRHYVGRQRQVRAEGSGLGLSIVEGLVDRLGGSVSAESTPGKGSTITVELPRTVS